MTTETGKTKKPRKTKESAVAATTVESCNCGDQIKVLEAKIEVLAQYNRTFNTFLLYSS